METNRPEPRDEFLEHSRKVTEYYEGEVPPTDNNHELNFGRILHEDSSVGVRTYSSDGFGIPESTEPLQSGQATEIAAQNLLRKQLGIDDLPHENPISE